MNELHTSVLDLHDATLLALQFNWVEGTLEIHIQADETLASSEVIRALGVRNLSCPRDLPWGFSDAINGAHLINLGSDSWQRLEIEMQSGDLLRFDALSFELEARRGQDD